MVILSCFSKHFIKIILWYIKKGRKDIIGILYMALSFNWLQVHYGPIL